MERERIPGRELGAVVAAGLLVAVAISWPLVLHLGSDVPQDAGDPLLQAWQVAWDGHAALHQPLHLFQANIFWPLPDSLAFSDALIGYTPFGLVGVGVQAAIVRYDLLFLGAYALAFTGGYLLARELGSRRAGAAVAGIAFACAPWRLGQAGHLHVLSSGGIALTAFLLLRGYRIRRSGLVLAGWLVAAWQVSLGFSLGLPLLYALLAAGVVVAAAWLRRGRPTLDRRLLRASAAGAAVLIAVSALLARPYLRVSHDHPEARRSLTEVHRLSPPVESLIAAAPDDLVWSGATAGVRSALPAEREQLLFPGLAIAALATLGIGSGAFDRRARRWLAGGTAVTLVLALGFRVWGAWSPYRLLWELPGWRGIRTPGRLFTFTSLALAVLAGAGAQRVIAAVSPGLRRMALTGALAGAVLLEGFGPVPHQFAPPPPAGFAAACAPLYVLPSDARFDNTSEFWSIDGFPQMVNGFSGFPPASLVALRAATRRFPDRRSVALLRGRGVRTVVLDLARAARTPWSRADSRPTTGLGVTRVPAGGVVLYRLGGC